MHAAFSQIASFVSWKSLRSKLIGNWDITYHSHFHPPSPSNSLSSVEEGKVTSFLLATTGIIMLRHSITKQKLFLKVSI